MPWRIIAVVVPMALACAGCWPEACTYGRTAEDASCKDRWGGVLLADEEDPTGWCGGDFHPFTTCDGLGYTAACGEWWYLPDSPALLDCRNAR